MPVHLFYKCLPKELFLIYLPSQVIVANIMVGTNAAMSLASGSSSGAESLKSTLALIKNFNIKNLWPMKIFLHEKFV